MKPIVTLHQIWIQGQTGVVALDLEHNNFGVFFKDKQQAATYMKEQGFDVLDDGI